MYGSNLMVSHWSSAQEGRFWNLCLPFWSGKPADQQKIINIFLSFFFAFVLIFQAHYADYAWKPGARIEQRCDRWNIQHDTNVGQRKIWVPNSARVMLNISSFTFNCRAQNSPSSFTYYYSWWIRQCWSKQYAGHLSHMNSVKTTLLSMSSRSSADRVPGWCSRCHGFDSCRGLRFFFVPRSCHVEYFIIHILLPSSKFTIFIHLSEQRCSMESRNIICTKINPALSSV